MDKEIIIKRLAFIKYIIRQSNFQSKEPEPLCGLAVLGFHDATELLLHLIAEKLNVRIGQDNSFMGYWTKLNPVLKREDKPELSHEASMNKLNNARVGLKHHGNLPSKSGIEEFRIITNTFFQESIKNIFDIDFDEVSLIDLIPYTDVKDYLKDAENYFKNGNIKDCVTNLAISFVALISNYKENKEGRYGDSPFYFGSDRFINLGFKKGNSIDAIRDLTDSVSRIRDAIKIISFGIDYRKFVKFAYLTPKPILIPGGPPSIHFVSEPKMTKEEFDYCYNFIIESALILQQFDFEIKDEDGVKGIEEFI